MVCLRGESPTLHINKMNFFNLFAAVAVAGSSVIAGNPVQAFPVQAVDYKVEVKPAMNMQRAQTQWDWQSQWFEDELQHAFVNNDFHLASQMLDLQYDLATFDHVCQDENSYQLASTPLWVANTASLESCLASFESAQLD